MTLHPGTEAPVLLAILLAQPLDLYQVGKWVIGQRTSATYYPLRNRREWADNGEVTDQLSLSLWLARGLQSSRLRHFEKLLQLFPFSQRPQPQSVVSIHAIDSTEPPLLERPVNGPLDPAEVMEILQGYSGDDVAYRVESWWDLWQFEGDWRLAPVRVNLACFGPTFDNLTSKDLSKQEDLRIDFGVDSHFLPQPDIPGSAKLVESNIKSLLRLVHELDSVLPVARRKLETESGDNFAHRLQEMLTGSRA